MKHEPIYGIDFDPEARDKMERLYDDMRKLYEALAPAFTPRPSMTVDVGKVNIKKRQTAYSICQQASHLVSEDRDLDHGEKSQNHRNIAELWNAFLHIRKEPIEPLSSTDIALMMCLLKIARTQLGRFNIDDYTDLAGYAGCAGEIASAEFDERRCPDGSDGGKPPRVDPISGARM